jgi:hypothetical protein
LVDNDINSVLGNMKRLGNVKSPASVVGKSGVQHQFSFATGDAKSPNIVGDVILGPGEKDETKVLSLFIKVYDIGAKRAILCVTPKLTNEAAKLARLYNILTVESPDPKQLPSMLKDLMERLAKSN